MNNKRTMRAVLVLLALCGLAASEFGVVAPTAAADVRPTARAWTADLSVVSDGRHIWMWAADTDPKTQSPRVALYHTDALLEPESGDESDPQVWEDVTRLSGKLAAHGAAASDNSLWLIFDNGAVQRVTLKRGHLKDQWFYSQNSAPSLPDSITVRATMAAHGKLWALLRVESSEALAKIDAAASAAADPTAPQTAVNSQQSLNELNLVLGLPRELPHGDLPKDSPPSGNQDQATSPPGTEEPNEIQDQNASSEDQSAETVEQQVETKPLEATAGSEASNLPQAPADRLLVLDRGRWQNVALPEDWEPDLPAHLVSPRRKDGLPLLFVQMPLAGEVGRSRLFRPQDAGDDANPTQATWTTTNLDLPTPGGVAPLRIEEQLVLVQHEPYQAGFAAQLSAVRGDSLTPVGALKLNADDGSPTTGRWNAVKFGEAVALLAGDRDVVDQVLLRTREPKVDRPAPGPVLAVIDLQGNTVCPPVTLGVEYTHPLSKKADRIILLTAVVTSTVMLFVFWRRNPLLNELQLPADLALAEPLRRGLAGIIDLTPGLWLGSWLYQIAPGDMYASWPGRGLGSTWEMMLPGVVAIGVIVGHTLLFELLTGGRSLGKLLTGLRVATLTGDKPQPWQTLVRCLLKSFDLVAYLLLILPVISPYKQRLGDMVAKTVVVAKAVPDASGDTEANDTPSDK